MTGLAPQPPRLRERIDPGSRWQPRSTSPAGRRVVNSRSKQCCSAQSRTRRTREHIIDDLTDDEAEAFLDARCADNTPDGAWTPLVVDTDVFSARLIANSLLARRYEPLLAGRGEIISFPENCRRAPLRRPGSAAGDQRELLASMQPLTQSKSVPHRRRTHRHLHAATRRLHPPRARLAYNDRTPR